MLAILAASIVASSQTFTCTPTHVWDGDGPVWCAEGPRIRIAGIAAREMDGSCRTNQPCPDATAIEARDALVQLMGGARGTISTGHVVVRGPRLSCRSEGSAGGSRPRRGPPGRSAKAGRRGARRAARGEPPARASRPGSGRRRGRSGPRPGAGPPPGRSSGSASRPRGSGRRPRTGRGTPTPRASSARGS